MYIENLKLKNFQKHKNLELEFDRGVNVICGPSYSGKSTVRRAISWILFNEPKGDVVRREGSKKTSVIINLSNGVEIEKIRSASINRYILRGDGEEKIFDKVGSTIPEQIKTAIVIELLEFDKESVNLNIAEQISLPFLLDKSGSSRMKLFNKLTGNDVLDKAFSGFNKDILKLGRNIKTTEEQVLEREEELKSSEINLHKIKRVLGKFKSVLELIKEKHDKFDKLLKLKELLKSTETETSESEKKLKSINLPQDTNIKRLTEKIEEFDNIKNLYNSLEKNDVCKCRVEDDFSKIITPDLDMEEIMGKIERFDQLNILNEKLAEINNIVSTSKSTIDDVEAKIETGQNKHDEILKNVEVCEKCGRPL